MNKRLLKKTNVIATVVVIFLFGLFFAKALNDILSSKIYTTEGKLIEEKVIFTGTRIKGTRPHVYLYFKLDSGEIAQICKKLTYEIKLNSRARIYYRKGALFHNFLYDYYEPI